MKIRQVVLSLIGLIGLGIAFGVGRYFQSTPLLNYDFTIYVHSGPTGKCIVRPPIQLMSYNNDRVQWASDDNDYWVEFINVTPPAGSVYPPIPPDPITHQPYVPESPLPHDENHVHFYLDHPTGLSKVKPKTKYYYFAIFDQTGNPCKVSTDDKDTGLNVKR
jgi:hypothetical protein